MSSVRFSWLADITLKWTWNKADKLHVEVFFELSITHASLQYAWYIWIQLLQRIQWLLMLSILLFSGCFASNDTLHPAHTICLGISGSFFFLIRGTFGVEKVWQKCLKKKRKKKNNNYAPKNNDLILQKQICLLHQYITNYTIVFL